MKYLLAAALLITGYGAGEAAVLAPHRAVYDLTLGHAEARAGLSSAEGRMVIEYAGSPCEGWTVGFRMATKYQPNEGAGRLIDSRSTSFESGEFLEYHYQQQDFIDSQAQPEERVKVSRQKAGGEGKGSVSSPAEKEFSLAAGAVFPVQHQLRLMDAAERGEPRDSSIVFDGTDGEMVSRVISVIGPRKPAGANQSDKSNPETATLAGHASSRMTISYYPVGGEEDTPSYQSTFDMYDNGVATNVVFDYGDFALNGKLTKLEMLKQAECK